MVQRKGLECILFIDDDETTNFIHQRIIKKTDIDVHVEVCYSAMEGLNYLKNSNPSHLQPDIIFLDINMSGMSGWDFLDEYEYLSENLQEETIMILLTTSIDPLHQQRGIANKNVQYFVCKPLTIEKIHEILNTHFLD